MEGEVATMMGLALLCYIYCIFEIPRLGSQGGIFKARPKRIKGNQSEASANLKFDSIYKSHLVIGPLSNSYGT